MTSSPVGKPRDAQGVPLFRVGSLLSWWHWDTVRADWRLLSWTVVGERIEGARYRVFGSLGGAFEASYEHVSMSLGGGVGEMRCEVDVY